METETTYALRQAILIAVNDAFGPINFERACRHSELYGIDTAMILDQWRILVKAGYLEPLDGSDGKYVRLSAKGAAQVSFVPGKADVFIHGVKAL